jgi:hypothetical protein
VVAFHAEAEEQKGGENVEQWGQLSASMRREWRGWGGLGRQCEGLEASSAWHEQCV